MASNREPIVSPIKIKSRAFSVKPYKCDHCNFGFTRYYNLQRHIQLKHRPTTCMRCHQTVSSLAEHVCTVPEETIYTCTSCDHTTKDKSNMRRHYNRMHSQQAHMRAKMQIKEKYARIAEQLQKKAEKRFTKEQLKNEKIKMKYADLKKKSVAKKKPLKTIFPCPLCIEKFSRKLEYEEHLETEHHPVFGEREPGIKNEDLFGLANSGFGKKIVQYVKHFQGKDLKDPFWLFQEDNSHEIVQYYLAKHKTVNVSISACVVMYYTDQSGAVVEYEDFIFNSKHRRLYLEKNVEELVKTLFEDFRNEIAVRLDNFEETVGSGWRVSHIQRSMINLHKITHLYEGRRGVSQKKKIDEYIRKNFFKPRNLENPPSDENECFYYCISSFFCSQDSGRKKFSKMELKQFINQNINKNIGIPARVNQISRFEEENCHLDFKVNVFFHDGHSKNNIYPLRPSKIKEEKKYTVNLLLMQFDDFSHYVLIKNMSEIIQRRYISKSGSKSTSFSQHEPCPYCFYPCSTKAGLKNHVERCRNNNPQKVVTVKKGTKLKFKHYEKQFKSPVFGCCDFEAKLIQPTVDCKQDTESSTVLNKQVPVSYSLAIFDWTGEILYQKTEASENNCMDLFFNALEEAEVAARCRIAIKVPHGLDEKTIEKMKEEASKCALCHEPFNSLKCDKLVLTKRATHGEDGLTIEDKANIDLTRVLDHNHLNGEVIGITHNKCNMRRKQSLNMCPIFVHNFSGLVQIC